METVIALYLSTIRHKLPLPQVIKNVLNGCLGRSLLITQFTYHKQLNGRHELEDDERSQSLGQILIKESDNFSASSSYIGENNVTHFEDTNESVASTGSATAHRTSTISRQFQPASIQFDWLLLAIAVDRLSFVVFSIIYIILIIVYAC